MGDGSCYLETHRNQTHGANEPTEAVGSTLALGMGAETKSGRSSQELWKASRDTWVGSEPLGEPVDQQPLRGLVELWLYQRKNGSKDCIVKAL